MSISKIENKGCIRGPEDQERQIKAIESFLKLELEEQLRFFLNASQLFSIDNLSKAKGCLSEHHDLPIFNLVIAAMYFSYQESRSITQNFYDKLVEYIKLIDNQNDEDFDLIALASTGLLDEETIELFAANPKAFKVEEKQGDENKELESTELENLKLMTCIIEEQKNSKFVDNIQIKEFNELESMEQLRFLLKASQLSIIGNLSKAKGLSEYERSNFIAVLKIMYFRESGSHFITQNFYDKLVKLIKLIDIQDEEDEENNGFLALLITGLLDEETIELFAANPMAFKVEEKQGDENTETESTELENLKLKMNSIIEEQINSKLVDCKKSIHKQNYEDLGLLELASTGSLDEENIELFVANPKDVKEISDVDEGGESNHPYVLPVKILDLIQTDFVKNIALMLFNENISKDCYDRLINCIKDTGIPGNENNGLAALVATGLLNEESIELFLKNPKAFKVEETKSDENTELKPNELLEKLKLMMERIITEQKKEQMSYKGGQSNLEPIEGNVGGYIHVNPAIELPCAPLVTHEKIRKSDLTAAPSEVSSSYNSNPPEAAAGESETNLKKQFTTAHETLFKKQKSEFGACLRNSIYFNRDQKKLVYTDDLVNILAHAVNNNNRSRQVCINLGWLDKNGKLNNSNTKLPEVIKQLYFQVTNEPDGRKNKLV